MFYYETHSSEVPGYKNACRSLHMVLKNDRPLRSLKEKAKESRKRRQKVPSRTAKQNDCFNTKPMFIMQSFSCILILLSYQHQWKHRFVITQGDYHFPAKLLSHLCNLLYIFHGVCKILHFIATKVTVTWPFFCNLSEETKRQHRSCREYCNGNPQSHHLRAVCCGFMA